MFRDFESYDGIGESAGGASVPITHPGMKLRLDVQMNDEGRPVLHFPFMSISDLHLGTKYARAKKLTHMLHNTVCDRLALVGDIIDGEHMLTKRKWNFGVYHRQVVASVLRKAAQGTHTDNIFGNHDEALRGKNLGSEEAPVMHRSLNGKEVFGINTLNRTTHTDPRGRRFLITHGDEYDDLIFKSPAERTFWYRLGDIGYAMLYELDHAVGIVCEKLSLEKTFSIAAWGKSKVKNIINERLGVRRVMGKAIDLMEEFDGAIYGHSHMAGFEQTPDGKTLMNDGCCTEHVQALVHDAQGNWAILEWHSDRLEIEEENGSKFTVRWDDIGLSAFREAVAPVEDAHSANADRLIRLMYRSWPPLERQLLVRKIHFMQHKMERLQAGGVNIAVLERGLESDREKLRTMPGPIAGKVRKSMPVQPQPVNDLLADYALEIYA